MAYQALKCTRSAKPKMTGLKMSEKAADVQGKTLKDVQKAWRSIPEPLKSFENVWLHHKRNEGWLHIFYTALCTDGHTNVLIYSKNVIGLIKMFHK